MVIRDIGVCTVGGNQESLTALTALLDDGCAVRLVIVPGPRLAARTSDLADVAGLATRRGIAVLATDDINGPDVAEALSTAGVEVVLVLGWSQLLGPTLLATPGLEFLGSHPAPLPEGRGRAPVPWTILQGLGTTAVSIFRIDEGVDTGPVVHQESFDIPERAHAGELYGLVEDALARAFVQVHRTILAGRPLEAVAQRGEGTYRHARRDGDGFLDFTGSADDLDRLVRAVSRPYPGAFGYLAGRRLRFHRSDGVRSDATTVAVPGTITEVGDDEITVATGDGLLVIGDIVQEGRPIDLRRGMRFDVIGGDLLARLADLEHRLADLEARGD